MQLLPSHPESLPLGTQLSCSEKPSGHMEKPHVGFQPTAFTEVTASAKFSWQVREGVET